MKRKFFTFILFLALSATVSFPAAASDFSEATVPQAIVSAISGISPLSEQTEWVTRIYNGKRQIRLWSITYNKWLTDWIDID